MWSPRRRKSTSPSTRKVTTAKKTAMAGLRAAGAPYREAKEIVDTLHRAKPPRSSGGRGGRGGGGWRWGR